MKSKSNDNLIVLLVMVLWLSSYEWLSFSDSLIQSHSLWKAITVAFMAVPFGAHLPYSDKWDQYVLIYNKYKDCYQWIAQTVQHKCFQTLGTDTIGNSTVSAFATLFSSPIS